MEEIATNLPSQLVIMTPEQILANVANQSLAEQRSTLAMPGFIRELVLHCDTKASQVAKAVLVLIDQQDIDGKGPILCADGAAVALCYSGEAVAVANRIGQQPLDVQRDILCMPDILKGLADNQQWWAAIRLLKKQPSVGQKAILVTPKNLSDLLRNADQEVSSTVLGFIKQQPLLSDRKEILMTKKAVNGLVTRGQINEVVELIQEHKLPNQQDILMAHDVMFSIACYASAQTIVDIVSAQPRENQEQLLRLYGVSEQLQKKGIQISFEGEALLSHSGLPRGLKKTSALISCSMN